MGLACQLGQISPCPVDREARYVAHGPTLLKPQPKEFLLKRSLRNCLLLSLLPLLGTSSAFADAITFFNTGIAANGTLLAAGSSDSHYNLIYNPDGASEIATATTANPAWISNTRSAGWISPGASGNTAWNAGYYAYETTLNLTGYDPATAILTGALAADDAVLVYLNHSGSPLVISSGFSSLSAFTINSGFVSGLNYVDFLVVNNSGPTGLLVANTSASANASALAPEPAALLLVATAIVVAGMVIRLKSVAAGSAGSPH